MGLMNVNRKEFRVLKSEGRTVIKHAYQVKEKFTH